MEHRDRAARLWDSEWLGAWKAHPENVWFAYEAGVYLEQLGPRTADRPRRVLKTDAFDEACGRGHLADALGPELVIVDVAPDVVRHAGRLGGAGRAGCVADVRALPFRAGAFDLILSTSTLDHFEAAADLDVALVELRRALAAGGRLLVTLDNPANPILRLRRLVHGVTGRIAGLIPFRMGRTRARAALVDAAERAGFAVRESGYCVHAPRVLALWAGEWAARRGDAARARRLGALLAGIDRLARRLPTRRWTAHFVFADCRPGDPREATAPHRPTGAAPSWLHAWKRAEQRLRAAYLRRVPAPVLARIDPGARRVATAVRRVAAVPLYLRHRLRVWTCRVEGEPCRLGVWSASDAAPLLLDALADAGTAARTPEDLGSHGVHDAAGRAAARAAGCELLIADTTPLLAPRFRRAGFAVVPGMVRFGGVPAALLAHVGRRPSALVGDLARLRRARYRVEVWSHTRARSRVLYDRYLEPHARRRFGAEAELPRFVDVDRLFAAGAVLAVVRPGAPDPDAMGLVVPRGDRLWCVVLGTRDGDPAVLRAGGIAAVYQAQIAFAHARGARVLDAGRCRPWASDGVFQYKWKWGLRPIPDGGQTLELAVAVLRPEGALARRLVARGVVIREGAGYRSYGPGDLSAR